MRRVLVLSDEQNLTIGQNYEVFDMKKDVTACFGCFGCWTKTPGKCVIKDHTSDFATTIPYVDEVVVVSRLVFGGFSPNIKAVFDRSIGFMLPFFDIVDGEVHHQQRYHKRPNFRYIFYGDVIQGEIETVKELVKANAINLGVKQYTVSYYETKEEIMEILA